MAVYHQVKPVDLTNYQGIGRDKDDVQTMASLLRQGGEERKPAPILQGNWFRVYAV